MCYGPVVMCKVDEEAKMGVLKYRSEVGRCYPNNVTCPNVLIESTLAERVGQEVSTVD